MGWEGKRGGGSITDAETLQGHPASYFAKKDHTHDEYALSEHTHNNYSEVGHTHDEYALADHEHDIYINNLINIKKPPISSLIPAQGNAKYINPADKLWYVDAEFTTLATDDTDAINNIIQYAYQNGYEGIYIPKSDGRYLINGNDLSDNTYYYANAGILIKNMNGFKIIMDPKAEIQVKTSDKIGYVIINVRDSSNIIIDGGNIFGDRDYHIGSTGEWGFGINISICDNVRISNIKIENCWGDGIIAQGRDGQPAVYSSNIYIDNVRSIRNRRQGLSIVSVKKMWVKNSYFANTNGTLPESGIDVECNTGYPVNENIYIENNLFEDNNRCDILLSNRADNIVVRNNICLNTKYAGIIVDSTTKNNIIIESNIIDASLSSYGMVISNNVKIYKNIIKNITVGIYMDNYSGDSEICDNTISDCAYGMGVFNTGTVKNLKICGNKIYDTSKYGIYFYIRMEDGIICNNSFKNCNEHAIFARITNCLVSSNSFEELQQSGIFGSFHKNQICNNSFKNNGLSSIDYPSIYITSDVGDNFIFGNRIRNINANHPGIKTSPDYVPATGNLVSKNDLRYGTATDVLKLLGTDINDENFTL